MADDRPVPPGLANFWNGPVAAFAELEPNVISDEQAERHRIFSLTLMAMLVGQWNGNKYGDTGTYPWREAQQVGTLTSGGNVYGGGSYLGHNIAAIAVDGEGRIIDYEFNHNQVFDSTVEHAESRLVRRVFSLNQIYEPWASEQGSGPAGGGPAAARRDQRPHNRRRVFATAVPERADLADPGEVSMTPADTAPAAAQTTPKPSSYATLLNDVTIYTSLESCAQCSGIMCLGSVKDIVYLQWDQGQFLIGNIMWQATNGTKGFTAPRPIRGDEFGFEYFSQLNEATEAFTQGLAETPFYVSAGGSFTNATPSVTSFLCTDAAMGIYGAAANELEGWSTATHADYAPTPAALTNQQVLDEAHDFVAWVDELDNRGAPHRV